VIVGGSSDHKLPGHCHPRLFQHCGMRSRFEYFGGAS
jgi:hypothetical protein